MLAFLPVSRSRRRQFCCAFTTFSRVDRSFATTV
jgi:hypothetical protein